MNNTLQLYRAAEHNGITVDCFELRSREALSYMDEDGNCYIAIDPFKLTGDLDEKMKLAHELGHCITGSFYNRYSPYDLRQRAENRADKWAIKQLVPKDELDKQVLDGRTEIWDLADYFDVSVEFMIKALHWYLYGCLTG